MEEIQLVMHILYRGCRKSSVFCLSILFFMGGVGSFNSVLANDGDFCDQKWWEISGNQDSGRSRDFAALLEAWNGLEKQCRGTGIYEIRLASILLMLDRYPDASELLENLDIPHNYQAQAKSVKLNAALYHALSKGESGLSELLRVRDEALDAVDKFPQEVSLNALLGNAQVLLGEFAAAVDPLEKAIRSDKSDLSGPYRNLVVAYSRSGQYEAAIGVIDDAYRLNSDITSDKVFMFAAANAYAAKGKPTTAKQFLTLILNKYPELKDDPEFSKAVLEAQQLSGGTLE